MPTPPDHVELPPYEARPTGAPLALEAIRVVDFSHFIAGPMATMLLGDFGADILKIEKPGHGDDYRAMQLTGNDKHGASFLWANRNKRSVALDLRLEQSRKIARALIDQADVVVENFTTGVMERFGLDYKTVSASNPRLIYCSVSAAGRTGPLAGRAGFDPIAQAESGLMKLNGHRDGGTMTASPPIVDMTTAMMACNTILAALVARDRLGQGQHVEVSLFDQSYAMLGTHGMAYLMTGINARPEDGALRPMPAIGSYKTLDGEIILCCANNRTYERLVVDVLGRPDLILAPFDTMSGRIRGNKDLIPQLNGALRKRSTSEWLKEMRAAGVPSGLVATVENSMTAPEAVGRGIATSIPHPTIGSIPNIASPSRMSLTPVRDPTAAPSVGQHTREVLAEVLG